VVDGSPKCRVEADIPSNLVSEGGDHPVSSLFLQGVSHDICLSGIKERRITCEQPELVGPTVPKTDLFLPEITVLEEDYNHVGLPLFDEYYSDDELQAYLVDDHYEVTEKPVSKQIHPMVPIYDEYESDLGETEPEEQNISCPEPVSEQPPPENNEPTSAVHHQPVLSRVIQPRVNNCVAKEAVGCQFSEICHSLYDPVGEYMEWHVSYASEPPCFISTPACKEELKSVSVLLSRLHHLLVNIDRRKELLSRKLLEWLWWKSAFT
jgi:hypothetical protein